MFIVSLLSAFVNTFANEVILSSGLGGWSFQQTLQEYTSYGAYAKMNIITTASILAYFINENGTLGVYPTLPTWTAEEFQMDLKKQFGLLALPCIYCDATIGNCANLSARLNNTYKIADAFIEDTINRAVMYNWDGYSVDFEPDDYVDPVALTTFMLYWGYQLNSAGLRLSVWVGGNVPYDARIYNSSYIDVITMNTYNSVTLSDFITVANPLLISSYQTGFGFLTEYGKTLKKKYNINVNVQDITQQDLYQILSWINVSNSSISLWASHIDPMWYQPLNSFLA